MYVAAIKRLARLDQDKMSKEYIWIWPWLLSYSDYISDNKVLSLYRLAEYANQNKDGLDVYEASDSYDEQIIEEDLFQLKEQCFIMNDDKYLLSSFLNKDIYLHFRKSRLIEEKYVLLKAEPISILKGYTKQWKKV